MENQNPEEIMAPDVAMPIRGGKEMIIVKEMNWKAAKLFLNSLIPHAQEFLSFDPQGKAVIDQTKLVGVLMSALGDEMLMAATGCSRAWVDALPSVDFFAVLQKAIELNVRPEMLVSVGKIIGQFRNLVTKLTNNPT